MKTPQACVLLLLFLLLVSVSCDKYQDVKGEVELYLLEEFEQVDETPEIDLSSIVLEPEPLISYTDLKSYNAKKHYFTVTVEAKEAVQAAATSVAGTAFAVTADEDVVYTGYFVPSYSS